MKILSESKLSTIFLTWIILPCFPFWILAVCFFAGFCNSGMKSVHKIRNGFNPFASNEENEENEDENLLNQNNG